MGVHAIDTVDDGGDILRLYAMKNSTPGNSHIGADLAMAQTDDGIDDYVQITG